MSQCVVATEMALGAASATGERVQTGALCFGYVEGFIDGAKGEVCIPPHSVTLVISSYLMYMKNNPRYYDMPKAAGLRAALDATYPCKK